MYVRSPKNKQDKKFSVRYDRINNIKYYTNPELDIYEGGLKYIIDHPIWSKRNIYDFLEFACGTYNFSNKNSDLIAGIKLKSANENSVGTIASGITYGNISNASSMYFDDKILSPRGHGFAAEHAKHLWDVFHGNDAKIVGDDNAKNGADRIVNNVNIQTKYCASGSKCIQECFENVKFRYFNPDGSPMQIEVPSDMYAPAIQAMKSRIERGEVAGVSDPAEAENIIRRGHFTYVQAKNIARAGTVESICYDAARVQLLQQIH